jgi:hypothetical protein
MGTPDRKSGQSTDRFPGVIRVSRSTALLVCRTHLEKLAARLNAPYLGTIVKGGGEGLRMMPAERTVDLFGNLQELARGFA